ncbi:MAG TPA: ABC transporter permease [Bryobacteraceae bacterium]|jgi:putative ABC transport system permease protein|nr:ABC transporter permease [Bryobacteraceae bacterium]
MDFSQSEANLYRALLYAYPAEFRHEYASEMERLFADRLEAEPHLRLWLETVPDLAIGALREHLHVLIADLRYAVRIFAANRASTALALLLLGIGIGASTAMFSLVNAVLLRSLPFRHPDQLVYLWSPNTRFSGPNIPNELAPNYPDYFDWQRLNHSFSAMAMLSHGGINLVRNNQVRRLQEVSVTGSFFHLVSAAPAIGRAITESDFQPGHEHVAVLSDALWKSEFQADPQIVGRQIRLDRESYSVIGVMPKGFAYPEAGDVPYVMTGKQRTDLWLPLIVTAKQKSDRTDLTSADAAIARLRPGVSPARAEAELKALERNLDPLYPPYMRGWTVMVRSMPETIFGPVKKMLWLLLGAALLVLLIAVSNVANLLLARMTSRAHELGVRTALGADRARLIRQLLTESLLLSFTGACLGVAFCIAAVEGLLWINPGGIPRFENASINGPVLLAALVLALATGFLCGIAPALFASRADVNEILKQGGNKGIAGGGQRVRSVSIAVQVALSVLLLTGTSLLVRSYARLMAVHPGFSSSTLTFSVALDQKYAKPEQRSAFYRDFLAKLRALPGVAQAGISTSLPLTNHDSLSFLEVKGRPGMTEPTETRVITPGFMQAMGVPLLAGRHGAEKDLALKIAPVLVNQTFVKRYLNGKDPVGQQIRFGLGEGSPPGDWETVIGVVGDMHHMNIETAASPQLFQIAMPSDGNAMNFALKTSRPTAALIPEVRAALHSLDDALAIENVETMGQRVDASNSRRTFQTALLAGFAIVAVLLALAGLYALLSQYVAQRSAEIGVRLALGASRANILRLIIGKGLVLTAIGIAVGLACAFAFSRFTQEWLFGISPRDPFSFVLVPVLLLFVACAACLAPAFAATRVDPVESLRSV